MCVKKNTIVIITVVMVIVTSFHCSPTGHAVDQRMERRNKVGYEEYATAGMHHDVSGKGRGFLGMMDGKVIIERASARAQYSQLEICKARES